MSGLVSPHPLGATLPALYGEDDLAQRFCSALDQVLAPVIATLDSFAAYLDPDTTPPDLLPWLGAWVGLCLDDVWPEERRRALIRYACQLHAWRGTPAAVQAVVLLATGVEPTLQESGGTSWSSEPGGALPGTSQAHLVVVLNPPPGQRFPARELHALITLVMAAHLPWRLELRDDSGPAAAEV